MVLTFRDVSKFAGVNPATEALISDGFIIDFFSFMPKFEDNQSVINPNLVYLYQLVKRSVAESLPNRASAHTRNAVFEAVSALEPVLLCSAVESGMFRIG